MGVNRIEASVAQQRAEPPGEEQVERGVMNPASHSSDLAVELSGHPRGGAELEPETVPVDMAHEIERA
jgi:hypothetical protein